MLSYPWSRFGGHLAVPAHRPSWLRVDRLLGEHGIRMDTARGREEFERRHKGDPAKLALAARLRRETTLTMEWIAARLHLGSVQSARVRVHALTKPTATR